MQPVQFEGCVHDDFWDNAAQILLSELILKALTVRRARDRELSGVYALMCSMREVDVRRSLGFLFGHLSELLKGSRRPPSGAERAA
jgi:hypothetical protein